MNFQQEYVWLQTFMSTHLQRSPDRVLSGEPFHVSELPPAIHTFRHRAEQFLLASGLTEDDVEKLAFCSKAPSEIFSAVDKVYNKETLTQKLPSKQGHSKKKEDGWKI
jgi:hypothetical protein